MRACLLLLLAPLAWGQFTVTFTPLSLAATERMFANGRDAGVWQIAVCAESPGSMVVPRERILQAAPQIPIMPNDIAEDLLTRKADASGWAVAKRFGTLAVKYAPLGITAYGLATGTPNLTKIGFSTSLAMDVLNLGVERAGARAPDPSKYYSQLLPDSVPITQNGCHTYLAVSGLIHNAAPVGPLLVDPLALPVAAPAPKVQPIAPTTGIVTPTRFARDSCSDGVCFEVLAAVWR